MASSRGGSGRRPQRLVFMPNFSNPVKDSKKSEHRQMVAKWAMTNRVKPTITPVPAPGSAVSLTPDRNRSSSLDDSSSPESQAAPSIENLPSSSSPPGPNDSWYADAPAPFGFIDKDSTQDPFFLPTSENDVYRDIEESREEAYGRPEAVKLRKQAKASARRRAAQASISSSRPDPILIDDDDDYLDDEDVYIINNNDDDDNYMFNTDNTITTLSRRTSDFLDSNSSRSPATIISVDQDPFDCLPVKNNPHTKELLYLYLNGHFLSPAITEGKGGRVERVKFYRQSTWFPLVMESKVTMNALIAYMESTPDLPVKSRSPDFLLNHVQAAYEGLRGALADPKTETDDSICVAVVLLMLTAQRLGDIATFRAHAKGLTQLLDARSRVLRHNRLLRSKEQEKWAGLAFTINGPSTTEPCNFCLDADLRQKSRSSSPESPEGLTIPEPNFGIQIPTAPIKNFRTRGAGFYDMISSGHLSPGISGFFDQILIWSAISERVRHDNLSAGAACTHAWVDERLVKLPPLDSAFFFSVRLCLYVCTWLEDSHSCLIVKRIAMAASTAIQNPSIDIPRLLEECPDGLLWLALVLGPFAEEDIRRQWFMCLLTRARHATAPSGVWDFDELMEYMSNLFIWTKTMTPSVRRFWDENTWDLETATAWMEDPF